MNKASHHVLVVVFLVMRVASAQTVIEPIGDLPGGEIRSTAIGVSGDGNVAVGGSEQVNVGTNDNEPVMWEAGIGLTQLTTGNIFGEARNASFNGSVIVGSFKPGGTDNAPFRWVEGEGMASLGFLPGGSNGNANDTTPDGSVVVGHTSSSNSVSGEAFIWVHAESGGVGEGTMQSLGFLSMFSPISQAKGISSDGTIVAGFSSNSSGDMEAVKWTNGTIVALGDLAGGAFASRAWNVSGDGNTAVGQGTSDDGLRAVLWRDGEDIHDLGPGFAYDVSYDGSIVVGGDAGYAFVWHKDYGMLDLNQLLPSLGVDLTGWTLTRTGGISNDGYTLVGEGVHNGQNEGWIVSDFVFPTSINISNAIWLDWNTSLGFDYQIQSSTNLNGWMDEGEPLTGTGTNMSFCEKTGSQKKFYRVIALP